MQYCRLCKVKIAGNKTKCPLCLGEIEGEGNSDGEVFPVVKKAPFSTRFVLCLVALVTITASSVCVLINIATANPVWWSLIVVFACLCAWTTTAAAIANRRDLTQNIAWQVVLASILSVLWDVGTGWHGWSINYALPCACAAGILTIPLLGVILRLPIRSFSGALIVCSVMGLAPVILIACGQISVALPSLICSGLAIVTLTAMLLFCWPAVKAELDRRFHM